MACDFLPGHRIGFLSIYAVVPGVEVRLIPYADDCGAPPPIFPAYVTSSSDILFEAQNMAAFFSAWLSSFDPTGEACALGNAVFFRLGPNLVGEYPCDGPSYKICVNPTSGPGVDIHAPYETNFPCCVPPEYSACMEGWARFDFRIESISPGALLNIDLWEADCAAAGGRDGVVSDTSDPAAAAALFAEYYTKLGGILYCAFGAPYFFATSSGPTVSVYFSPTYVTLFGCDVRLKICGLVAGFDPGVYAEVFYPDSDEGFSDKYGYARCCGEPPPPPSGLADLSNRACLPPCGCPHVCDAVGCLEAVRIRLSDTPPPDYLPGDELIIEFFQGGRAVRVASSSVVSTSYGLVLELTLPDPSALYYNAPVDVRVRTAAGAAWLLHGGSECVRFKILPGVKLTNITVI